MQPGLGAKDTMAHCIRGDYIKYCLNKEKRDVIHNYAKKIGINQAVPGKPGYTVTLTRQQDCLAPVNIKTPNYY